MKKVLKIFALAGILILGALTALFVNTKPYIGR